MRVHTGERPLVLSCCDTKDDQLSAQSMSDEPITSRNIVCRVLFASPPGRSHWPLIFSVTKINMSAHRRETIRGDARGNSHMVEATNKVGAALGNYRCVYRSVAMQRWQPVRQHERRRQNERLPRMLRHCT